MRPKEKQRESFGEEAWETMAAVEGGWKSDRPAGGEGVVAGQDL